MFSFHLYSFIQILSWQIGLTPWPYIEVEYSLCLISQSLILWLYFLLFWMTWWLKLWHNCKQINHRSSSKKDSTIHGLRRGDFALLRNIDSVDILFDPHRVHRRAHCGGFWLARNPWVYSFGFVGGLYIFDTFVIARICFHYASDLYQHQKKAAFTVVSPKSGCAYAPKAAHFWTGCATYSVTTRLWVPSIQGFHVEPE